MLRVPSSDRVRQRGRRTPRTEPRIDFGALQQWATTGEITHTHSGPRRRYRLGRWQSQSMSSWNPPNATELDMSVPQMASRSRRSLVSIDICHKPSEPRRMSMSSMQQPDILSDDEMQGETGPLAQLLLRENEEIWSNTDYRYTFYSPSTGTVRATDVQTLRTDNAKGLAELIQQALGRDVRQTGPQLSVTSADSDPGRDVHVPDNEFLHPNYSRGQGARLQGALPETPHEPDFGNAEARLFWLDVTDPGADEVHALAQIFDLHPLTVEELLTMRDQAQDSIKSFRHYDVMCYRTSSVLTSTKQSGAYTPTAYDPTAYDTEPLNAYDESPVYAPEPILDTASKVSMGEKSMSFVRDIAQRVRPVFARPNGDAKEPVSEEPTEDTLDEPVAFYMIVLDTGVVTLHHGNVPHVRNTVARLKLDEDAVRLTPDYVAYLLLDDITDTLVPTTRLLELEVDTIDELVLILTRAEHDDVLKRIGIERRHALWLVRLLHGKAEVLRAVERRVHTKGAGRSRDRKPRDRNTRDRNTRAAQLPAIVYNGEPNGSDSDAPASQLLTSDEEEGDLYGQSRKPSPPRSTAEPGTQPDVAKYLADVHDHLISLTASVHHCERILARAHGNYLARINLELTHASNTTNQLATQMTVLAGIFLPLNLVAGVFGMNVKVPGRDRDDLRDFGLILAAMGVFVVVTLGVCRWRRII
ncbi:CorA metal ion transporter [Coemansia sp. RSA 1591]|nr:CorA metal ion transporter [Coemansia sp. RSA 1591]KAJ1770429.1 CorA metal ion transporter [Coemansia sp. RSA 1824]